MYTKKALGLRNTNEIRGRCTLATAVSAVAEPGRTESEGAWHNEWTEADDGVRHLTEWMLGEEGWVVVPGRVGRANTRCGATSKDE